MKHPYFDLDLIRLSAQDGATTLDKQFLVIDNLDEAQGNDDKDSLNKNLGCIRDNSQASASLEVLPSTAQDFFVNYPVKISFSIAIFCVAGEISFRINLQEYTLRANDLLVVMEGNIGEFVGMSDDAKMAVIAFGDNYFKGTTLIEETMLLEQRLHTSPLCHLTDNAMQECLAIYRLAKSKIAEAGNPFRRGALMGYAQVLTNNAYYYLARSEERGVRSDDNISTKDKSGRQYELYRQFMVEVQQHYTQERSVKYYADRLCVTPKYLSQIIRNVSGKLAGEWITDFVILEAKALLKSRKLTIQQIADSLNFANQSFFGRYFKDNVGMSPTKYRNE